MNRNRPFNLNAISRKRLAEQRTKAMMRKVHGLKIEIQRDRFIEVLNLRSLSEFREDMSITEIMAKFNILEVHKVHFFDLETSKHDGVILDDVLLVEFKPVDFSPYDARAMTYLEYRFSQRSKWEKKLLS